MQINTDGRIQTEASVVALGMFDGVHLGHQVLLRKARAVADRYGVPLVVQTFAEHPLQLITPDRCPPLLTTAVERARLIAGLGVDIYFAPPFTQAMRTMPPEEFVGRLVRQWHPKAVVVGFNYTFGADGVGTPAWLRTLGQALGFETYVVPAIRHLDQVVSATVIREHLERGDARGARLLLGRCYTRSFTVQARKAQTLRLLAEPDGKALLPAGRYRALLQAEGRAYPATVLATDSTHAVCRIPQNTPQTEAVTLCYLSLASR